MQVCSTFFPMAIDDLEREWGAWLCWVNMCELLDLQVLIMCKNDEDLFRYAI